VNKCSDELHEQGFCDTMYSRGDATFWRKELISDQLMNQLESLKILFSTKWSMISIVSFS
jgi:hypothetical protein